MKKLFLLSAFTFVLDTASAQTNVLLPTLVVGTDTFAVCTLQEIVVVTKRTFASQTDQYRYNQLKRNILIVYPYSKEAGALYNEINSQLSTIGKKKEEKKLIKEKEKELDDLYENSLKNLTVTQGDILVKLIARETGMSVYELIKEFKNPVSAFYWNKLSGVYGYSLKQEYDPQEERDIEMIVRSIEGTL
jgi:hypothetical protein